MHTVKYYGSASRGTWQYFSHCFIFNGMNDGMTEWMTAKNKIAWEKNEKKKELKRNQIYGSDLMLNVILEMYNKVIR